MFYQKLALLLLVIQICIMQTCHTIDVRDTKVFEIALDDMNYDEENENEMIQPADLVDLRPLTEDESKYRALHSHVKHYNERNTEDRRQFLNVLPYLRPHAKESFSLEDEKPFIAGFKHDLDKLSYAPVKTITEASTKATIHENRRRNVRNHRNREAKFGTVKREEEAEIHYGTAPGEEDFFQMTRVSNDTIDDMETTGYLGETSSTHSQYDEYDQETTDEDTERYTSDQFVTSSGVSTPAETESPDEEPYDYEAFKLEYEQQLKYGMKSGKIFNYTEEEREELEDTPKQALKRILDIKQHKNCTKEEMTQIGIKAIECLAHDYQRARDMTTIGKMFSRTWLVLRVWLLIYICLAILCWCQRGWCCCCFRCKFCFPRRRILFAKEYYAWNPPGILVKDLKKKDVQEPITYEATSDEHDTYKTLEAAIRNI